MLHTYLAQDLIHGIARPEADEFLEIVEVHMSDAIGLIRSGEIKDTKTISGIMMAREVIGEL